MTLAVAVPEFVEVVEVGVVVGAVVSAFPLLRVTMGLNWTLRGAVEAVRVVVRVLGAVVSAFPWLRLTMVLNWILRGAVEGVRVVVRALGAVVSVFPLLKVTMVLNGDLRGALAVGVVWVIGEVRVVV